MIQGILFIGSKNLSCDLKQSYLNEKKNYLQKHRDTRIIVRLKNRKQSDMILRQNIHVAEEVRRDTGEVRIIQFILGFLIHIKEFKYYAKQCEEPLKC